MDDFMFDPGHDKNTLGKRALDGSMREFEFNKETALKAGHLIQQYEGASAVFSHDLNDGVDTSLTARANLANQLNVKAVVSIHANAGDSSARGIETYIHLNAPDSTYRLAKAIHDNVIKETGQKDRGVKRADFAILRQTHMDAILIECGFMTNEQDLALLKSDGYRGQCAEGIVKGLAEFYGLKKKEVAPPPLPPVYTVTIRDFNSEEAVNEFRSYIQNQYPNMGIHVEKLR